MRCPAASAAFSFRIVSTCLPAVERSVVSARSKARRTSGSRLTLASMHSFLTASAIALTWMSLTTRRSSWPSPPGPACPSRPRSRPPCGSPCSTGCRTGPRACRSGRPRTCRSAAPREAARAWPPRGAARQPSAASSPCVLSPWESPRLELELVDELAHGGRRLVERGLLGGRELDLDDLLHAPAAELDGDAHID